jgi:hypothetical protein
LNSDDLDYDRIFQEKEERLKNQKKLTVLGLAVLLIVGMSTLMVVKAFSCEQGCTPGFWKNPKHFDQWYMFSPNQLVGDAFYRSDEWRAEFNFLKGLTLLEALQKKGGNKGLTDLEKAARIYLRQAVATLLNTTHPMISGYPTHWGLMAEVRETFKLTSPSIIEAHKDMLQRFNELGSPICE